ncbi:MAG: hypothetical protein Q9160_000657 [Pyrenula sp. 1 TL-2023]
MSEPILFEERFNINAINSQKYDRVSRITATAGDNLTSFTLDVNTELYPLATGDEIQLALASTLHLDGSRDDAKGWREVGRGEQTLADEYDYVCYGKVYRFVEGEGDNIKVFVSFGGLLLYMEGPYKKLNPLHMDNVYLLVKK